MELIDVVPNDGDDSTCGLYMLIYNVFYQFISLDKMVNFLVLNAVQIMKFF